MPNIAVYTSAHGYGHTARCYEVARQLVRQNPGVLVHFMSSVADSFFIAEEHSRILRRRLKLDVGIRQIDSLNMDLPGTLRELDVLQADSSGLVASEAEFLRRQRVDIVLADLPHLAFEAAAQAGIPAYGLSNFTWDWIYQGYLKNYPAFVPHIRRIRRACRTARILFRLPFSRRMDAFQRIEDVPLIARKSEAGKDEARRRLGLKSGAAVILFSFGGFGLNVKLADLHDDNLILLSTDPSPDPGPPFTHLSDARLAELGLRYADLVAAADAVVSKPGYGIVSECIANRTRLLYTPRGPFREYPVLVRDMPRYLPVKRISLKELADGSWGKTLEKLLAMPYPAEVRCDGARVVAEKIMNDERPPRHAPRPKGRG